MSFENTVLAPEQRPASSLKPAYRRPSALR